MKTILKQVYKTKKFIQINLKIYRQLFIHHFKLINSKNQN